MKTVDAVWEKRNLGISCVEISVEKADAVEELELVLHKIEADYTVVKIPTCRMDLSENLLKHRFCFAETLFSLEKRLGKHPLTENQQEKSRRMTYRLQLIESEERIQREIQMGMYTTDRISVDRHFTPSQTANRYIGMLSDELRRGAEIIEYYFDDEPFGFSCFRETDVGRYYQALTGIYRQYRGKGLGFALAYLPERELLRRGAEVLTTGVSANNEASLVVHLQNGFLPTETTYVYVKHRERI